MKIHKNYIFFCLVISFFLITLSCSKDINNRSTDKFEENNNDKLIIGAAMCTTTTPYLSIVTNEMISFSKDKDIILDMKDANWNVETQIDQLEQFMEDGVDAIIVTPVNIKSLKETLNSISEKGIPIINLNMKVDMLSSQYITTYVGASSEEEAVLSANLFLEALGEEGGQVVIIEGKNGSDPTIYRTQAFIEELKAHPEIEIIELASGNWEREKSYLATLDLLKKYPNLDGIYCHDTEMAMGAIKAIEELEITKKIIITGISGKEEYYKAIESEKLYGLITQPPIYEARTSIYCAIQAAKGEIIMPWYKDPIEIVTKDNVSQYL